MSFFEELKRRNVFRVGIAYVVVGWLLLQVTDIVVPIMELPNSVAKVVLFLLMIGFPLVIFFAWAFELTPEGVKREKDVDRSQSITSTTGRKLDFAIIGILVLAVGILLIDKFGTSEQAIDEPVAAAEVPAEGINKSIAVLPFVNMSEDAANEFFSDGISEEILNALAKVKDLKVAGRTSSFAFKGRNEDLREIGEALGVKHILEGSVRKAGNTVRITAQLIQVDDGFHLWSDTYDRELTNIFAIQDEIANSILVALKAELLDEEFSDLAATKTDTQAYEKFLLAKQRIYDRNEASLEAAASLLDDVLEADPAYAPAYAQRAIVYLLLVEDQYGEIPREVADPAAREFADKALQLDPGLAEAWAASGLYYNGQPSGHDQAIEHLEKALSINPGLIDASNWLQIAFGNAGQPQKSVPIIEDMLERDPLYRPAIGNAVNIYTETGQQEKAMALIERVRPYIPDDAHLLNYESIILQSLGRYSEAIPLSEEAIRRQPADGLFRNNYGFALWSLQDYEKLAGAEFNEFQRAIALEMLDRREEATIIVNELAAKGFPGSLIFMMSRNSQFEQLVQYVDERWPTPAAYQESFPHGSFGYGDMISLALAYSKTGNDPFYRDALTRVRTAHDGLISNGVDNFLFSFVEARYFAVSGDYDSAIEQLGIAVDKGFTSLASRIASKNPSFEPLEGDPRYEEIQARMVENLNRQRAELGLEPSST
jgi:TolB-like protein